MEPCCPPVFLPPEKFPSPIQTTHPNWCEIDLRTTEFFLDTRSRA
jgi:hypothetical protein